MFNNIRGVCKTNNPKENVLNKSLDFNRFVFDFIKNKNKLEFTICDYEEFVIKFYKTIFSHISSSTLYHLYCISLIDMDDDNISKQPIEYSKFNNIYKTTDKFDLGNDILEKIKPFLPIEFYIAEYLVGNKDILIVEKIKMFIFDFLFGIVNTCNNHMSTVKWVNDLIYDTKSGNSILIPTNCEVDVNKNNYKERIISIFGSVPNQHRKFLELILDNLDDDINKILCCDIDNTINYFPGEGLTLRSSTGNCEHALNDYLFEYIYKLYNISNNKILKELSLWT